MELKNKKNYRSLHLDCARHFFSVETVKKVIEGISYGNLNVLHWHLSDDHGWSNLVICQVNFEKFLI